MKDAISAAWDAAPEGRESPFDPLVLAHVAGGGLVPLFALWRLAIKAEGARPRRSAAARGHNILKIALLALVALHVVGALYHHFVLKDGLINRMRRTDG